MAEADGRCRHNKAGEELICFSAEAVTQFLPNDSVDPRLRIQLHSILHSTDTDALDEMAEMTRWYEISGQRQERPQLALTMIYFRGECRPVVWRRLQENAL